MIVQENYRARLKNGMAADVFMSAATEQMNNLVKGKYISKGDVVELLENKVVLIAPKKGDAKVSSFKDITKADTIALGDPKSVPAGQYAQEILTNLKNWNDVKKKVKLWNKCNRSFKLGSKRKCFLRCCICNRCSK